ncbi:DNRLRE domain-containing protein [Brevibacillus centrosporus]|uniref:DNRLRE domain-containing protein n=1 Tax=Brevibacillus centrosporus TaxID=54910 RepID=UPI003B02C2AD
MPVVTLTKSNVVTRDTYVNQNDPSTPNNTAATLLVGAGSAANQVRRALFFFDLGLIPNDAIINSATLKLHQTSGYAGSTINIHKITGAWADTVLWGTQPTFDPSPSASLASVAGSFDYNFDVTALVQEWVNGIAVNNGFLAKDSNENDLGTSRDISSFNHTTTAYNPTLTIDYTIPSTGKKQVEYVGVGINSSATSTTSYTATLPSNIQAGDLLIAFVGNQGSGTTITPPSGWTEQSKISNNGTHYVFSKIASASETNPTFTSTAATGWMVSISNFRNVKGINTKTSNAVTSTSSYSPPAITSSVSKALVVTLIEASANSYTWTPPLSFTEAFDSNGPGAINLRQELNYRYLHDRMSLASNEMVSSLGASASGAAFALALEPVTNNVPTLTLTSPTDNQTLVEGNNYPVEGNASDSDSGNVMTVKYKINNGTARALASGVSDGSSPLSFAKTLKYSNKRVWDGATDVSGVDLAENTDHNLTVWSEDDQGAKSAEVTRKFRVIWNRPPTISDTNRDLGIIEEAPSINYTVTDPETNAFTVTEKINGSTIRSFAGVAGRQETVTIPLDTWLRLEPGVLHTLTIEATDNQGMTSSRAYTLTRFVDKIIFNGMDFSTLAEEIKAKFTTDVAAQRLLLTPVWDMPPGVTLLVEVCNNAYDAEPAWEDATVEVKLNRTHLFSNTTKTAEQWGINFRFVIEKGTAIAPVYFRGVGGAFD